MANDGHIGPIDDVGVAGLANGESLNDGVDRRPSDVPDKDAVHLLAHRNRHRHRDAPPPGGRHEGFEYRMVCKLADMTLPGHCPTEPALVREAHSDGLRQVGGDAVPVPVDDSHQIEVLCGLYELVQERVCARLAAADLDGGPDDFRARPRRDINNPVVQHHVDGPRNALRVILQTALDVFVQLSVEV